MFGRSSAEYAHAVDSQLEAAKAYLSAVKTMAAGDEVEDCF
jgi:hypothetical protein